MKRLLMVLSTALLLTFSVFAVFRKSSALEIAGYYDNVFSLSVTNLLDASDWSDKNGINLNYTDTGNANNTYLIAPTNIPLSKPGLKIGTFDLMVSFSASIDGHTSANLTITHDKLIHTTDSSTAFDYELAVNYDINNGNTITSDVTKICYSADTTLNGANSIVIPIVPYNPNAGLCAITSAGLFFRLSLDDVVDVEGSYVSTIKFEMEMN